MNNHKRKYALDPETLPFVVLGASVVVILLSAGHFKCNGASFQSRSLPDSSITLTAALVFKEQRLNGYTRSLCCALPYLVKDVEGETVMNGRQRFR